MSYYEALYILGRIQKRRKDQTEIIHSSDPARKYCLIYPILLTKVPDLQEISAVSVAKAIWNHVNVAEALWQSHPHPTEHYLRDPYADIAYNGTRFFSYPGWRDLFRKLTKLVDELPVPKSIAQYITKYMEKLSYEIQDWVSYHRRSILFGGTEYPLYRHIPSFTWYPDGTVDNKTTALKLLSSEWLSIPERYKFLCTYCLEDELVKLAPMVVSKNLLEFVEFSCHPLIFYWNCYFRNKLSMIPVTGNLSVDNFMFQHDRVDNWWAKEYFFNRLNSAEKVQGAVSLIDKFEVWCQELILMKLDESERINVYMQRPVQIISNYSKTGTHAKEILSTWFDIRHLITADQFVAIFDDLLGSQNVDAILPEVWSSACDDFKHHLSTYNNYEIMKKILELQLRKEDVDLFIVLSDVNMHVKKSITEEPFFRTCCDTSFRWGRFELFGRLIKEFVKAEEVEQFRQHLVFNSATVKDKCISFYLKRRVNELDDFLTQLLPSHPDIIEEYKKNLLMSNVEAFITRFGSDPSNIEMIVSDGLPTEDLKSDFKKKLISSGDAISKLQWWFEDNRLDDIKRQIDYYLTSNEDKKILKKRLVTDSEDKLVSMFAKGENRLKTVEIQHLLAWWLEDDASFVEFKSNLRVDFIFDKLLEDAIFSNYDSVSLCRCDFWRTVNFACLDRFLNWYFELPGRVKEYKLRRIDSYNQMPVISTLLEEIDEKYLRSVMKWFFEEDVVEIEKFKMKYSQEGKIINVL